MARTGDIIAGIMLIMGTVLFFVDYGSYFKEKSEEEKQGQVYLWPSLLLILAAFLWFTVKMMLTKLD